MHDTARLSRRQLLEWLGAGAAAATLPGHALLAATDGARAFVTSDFARLKRVLVATPSPDGNPLSRVWDDVLPLADVELGELVREHAQLVEALRASGAEVLVVSDLLDAAIEQARRRGTWEAWLRATHPRLAADPGSITARTLLGRDPGTQFQTWPDGSYRHVVDSVGSFIFTRDTAVTVPQGVVLLNVGSRHRMREQVLLRFLFDCAPQLAGYPIVFDARQEGLLAEGGDFQVVDEHTLFIGVGNRTDPRIAPILARRLGMDVLAVQTRKAEWLRPAQQPNPMRIAFMHLDTYFTHLGERQALTLPWFLESAHAGKDPYTRFLKGIAPDGAISDEDLAMAEGYVRDLGRVRLYRAGSGNEDDSVKEMKLVDYVRSRGYTVHFVGGDVPANDEMRHLFKVVLYEHERQAANVVATAPGRVIAYEGSPVTHAALRKAGIHVTTFPARELWPWSGGPHCLTMPLERS